MATIDQRIVSMVFENAKFEAGIAQSMETLKKFNDALGKTGQTNALGDIEKQANKVTLNGPMSALDKLRARFSRSGADAAEGMGQIDKAGNRVTLQQPITALGKVQSAVGNVGARAPGAFNEIEKSADRVSFGGLTSSLGNVTAKFSTLQAAASVALGNIASKAMGVGTNMVKSLTLSPVMAGFHNYETQINAVQTIMANTGLTGKKGLGTVQTSLDELNTYANKTVYNFSEMAKNIGTFTAAGVQLKPAVASIKGIANLAALSGSNSQQAGTAMYQLSQAIAAGKVGLQDWNSVVNAGMGGAVFQKSLMRTAENMGTIKKGAVEIDKATGKATVNGQSFRESIMAKPGQTSWLTSDVLVKTLGQFTGDMTAAQLASQGFSQEQIKAIQTQAKAAQGAATNIKTFSQLMDALKEEVATAWSSIFKTVFGNIFDATAVFSKVHTAIENFLTIPIYNFNKVLQGWAKLGGRADLFKGIHKAVQDLGAVIKPIKDAFREIFPPATAKSLFTVTEEFKHLMDRLTIGHKAADNIRRTFAGLFAVLHIGVAIVKGVVGVIGQLIGTVGHGSGGVLNFTGSIGDFLVSLDKTLVKGGALKRFFDGLASVLKVPLHLLGNLTSLLGRLFGGVGKATNVTDGMNAVKGAAGPLASILHTLKKAWDGLVQIFRQAKDLVSPWLDKIGQDLSQVGDTLKRAFQGQNLDKVMSVLQTTFIGGIFIVLKKAITGGTTQLSASLGGLGKVFGQLTGNLQTMQQKIKAQIILEIAAAIGILAAAAFVMSKIPPGALGKAMLAIAVGLGELMGAMKLITGGMGAAGFAKIPVLAAGMILLASSMVILGGAAKIFASMSWNELAKGLIGIGGGLAAIGLGMKLLGPGTIAQGPAILVLAIALNVLALAVKQFASMSWKDLAKGLAGVMFSLVAIAAPLEALTAIGPSLLITAPALIGLGIALNLLAHAVGSFGKMDLKTMLKGFIGMTATLLILSEAMWAFPPGPYLILQAAGLGVLAMALSGIAVATSMFGHMGVGTLVKGMLAMGASLLVLGAGLYFMEGTLPGAAALLLAAGALGILAPALGFLGHLKFSTIIKGLAAIGLVLGVLAVAGTFAAPGISALGVSLLPLAGVFILTAGAVFLFAKALQVMGGAGTKGVAVMVAALTGFILLLPKLIISLVKGIIESVAEVVNLLPKVVDSLAKILGTLIDVITKLSPKIAVAVGVLVTAIVAILARDAPKLIGAGIKLLENLLSGIAKNIGKVTDNVALIIERFLGALTEKAPDLIAAGAKFLAAWITGIGNAAGRIVHAGINAVAKFILGVAGELPKLATLGLRVILRFLSGVAQHVGQAFTRGAHILLSLLSGIASVVPKIIGKAADIAGRFVRGVAHGLVKLADVGATAIIDFLNGMAHVIRKRGPQIRHAGYNLAGAMIDGLLGGFGELWHKVTGKISELAHKLPGWFRKPLGIHSPSQVFHEIGGFIMEGLTNGITKNSAVAEKSMGNVADSLTKAAKKKLGNVPGLLDGIIEKDPTIRPVLDLSQVKKDAGALGDITSVPPLKASLSMDQASVVSQQKQAADQAQADLVAASAKPSVKFEQNNYSPEALSTAEIYRRTNNQLSQVRKATGLLP